MMNDNKNITIISVGDIFFGEHPVTLGHGVNTGVNKFGCEYLFKKIKDNLHDGDIICGNLEGIISPKNDDQNSIINKIFWGNPECASVMANVGFNCLFLANNHCAQHGKMALEQTCLLLDNNGINWTGYNPRCPNSSIPVIFNIKGLRIGFLAYCETQQYHLENLFLSQLSYENIKQDVQKLKRECDLIVVSLHWGDEFINYPSPDQIHLAHKIIDLGVNLILGHHSHTMQGIERYKHGLIAYSLGNFINNLWPRKLRESVILKCNITPPGIISYQLYPIYINDNYQPVNYSGKNGEIFLKHIDHLTKALEEFQDSDFGVMRKRYERDVKRLLFLDRLGTIWHYIRNIFRYDKKLLFQNILLMFKRRIYIKNF